MRYVHVYVGVVLRRGVDGEESILAVVWPPTGKEYRVDSCVPLKRMRCERTYGDAFRYECSIGGRRRLVYRDDDGNYFVEAPAPKGHGADAAHSAPRVGRDPRSFGW